MKVLIVDDEVFSIKILETLVNWKTHNIDETYHARGGYEALQKAMEIRPEILITDIRMPDMSGLDLAEKVLRAYPETKVILMSAYADFSYIKDGMKLGCIDYILKPIDEAEFERTLKRAVSMIEGEKEQEETNQRNASRVDDLNLLRFIRSGHGKNKVLNNEIARFSGSYVMFLTQLSSLTIDDYSNSENIEIEHEGYYLSIMKNILSPEYTLLKILNLDEGSWIILMKDRGQEETIRAANLLNRELFSRTGHSFTVCFSRPYAGLDSLNDAYDEVRRLNKYGLALGDHEVIGMDYNCSAEDLETVRTYRAQEKKEGDHPEGGKEQYSESVRGAMRIIETNYAQNLSLEDICSELSISKNYFSYVFKRETGMNLWDYLTRIRLAHAKKLLAETDMRNYEIAFKVGYDNPSYFSKLFKKYENMTPGEYRDRETGNS